MSPTLERTFESRGPEETERLAESLGARLTGGVLIDLRGPLGAGKTAFVRGLARGLGATSSVRSPTFTLWHEHDGRVELHHLDVYRLEDPGELLWHGWDEKLAGGVLAVEWGEKIATLLPEDRLIVELEHVGEGKRRIVLTARGEQWVRWLGELTIER